MPAPTMSFDEENQEILPPAGPIGQELQVSTFGAMVTAQRVAVPRNEKKIIHQLREWAAVNGDNYYYEWETKNRDGSKGLVSGVTIKGAMLVVRLFGNSAVDVRAVPFSDTHDMFYARFADLETGFSTVRAFKQRRSQNIGMKDKERGEDIIFQIGQSKAIRNVINNALQDFCADLVEKSRNALIERMENDGKYADKVAASLKALMAKHSITDKMAETYIGFPLDKWDNRHIAKMYVAVKSIDNGDANVNDVFASEATTIKTADMTDPVHGGVPQSGDAVRREEKARREGGKEGDGTKSDGGSAGSRARKPRQSADSPATVEAASAAGGTAEAQAPKEEAQPADAAQAKAQAEAVNTQPESKAAAPAPSPSGIAQGAAADNLSAAPTPRQQTIKQPPAPPVDEDESWFSSEEA